MMLRSKISLNWDQLNECVIQSAVRELNHFIIKENIKYFCQLMVLPLGPDLFQFRGSEVWNRKWIKLNIMAYVYT